MRNFVVLLILALSATQFCISEATAYGPPTGNEPDSEGENVVYTLLSSELLANLSRAINAGSSKAANDSSDSSFAKGIWGAFTFILIGLAVFVAGLIFLIRFFDKPSGRAGPKTRSNENLMYNSPPQQNTTAPPEARSFAPQPTPTTYDNRAFEDTTSPYPTQQQQYQPYQPPNNYNNQVPDSDPQPIFSRFTVPHESTAPPPNPQYTQPPPAYDFPPQTTSHTAPIYPALNYQSKSGDSEYFSEYTDTKPQEPFKYLDKYPPPDSTYHTETNEETNTKRAVLRHTTPYQFIEDRVQGEDYDDTDTFAHDEPFTPPGLNPPPPPPRKPVSSSGSFNDGKTMMVRVLPRVHHGGPILQSQQQMDGYPVFKPVAPPAPPQSNNYYI